MTDRTTVVQLFGQPMTAMLIPARVASRVQATERDVNTNKLWLYEGIYMSVAPWGGAAMELTAATSWVRT